MMQFMDYNVAVFVIIIIDFNRFMYAFISPTGEASLDVQFIMVNINKISNSN